MSARHLAVLAVLLTLAAFPLRADTAPAGARQLVTTAGSALDGVALAARAPKGGLDPRNPRHAAFLAALSQFQGRLQTIASALDHGGRTAAFFAAVDLGSADLGAVRVAWARAGVDSPAMAEGIRVASTSYRLLRSGFGREGLRQQQGGTLTEAERRQLRQVQQAQRRFAASLAPLRDQARRAGDAVTAAELDRFRAEAERIARARLDLESYLNALIAAGELRGEWAANAPYVHRAAAPKQAAAVAAADQAVEDLYADSDLGEVFAVNLGDVSAPAEAGASGAADAVQVFEPTGGEGELALALDGAADEDDADDGPVEGIEVGATTAPAAEEEPEVLEAAAEEPGDAAPAAAPAEAEPAPPPGALSPAAPATPAPVKPPAPAPIG